MIGSRPGSGSLPGGKLAYVSYYILSLVEHFTYRGSLAQIVCWKRKPLAKVDWYSTNCRVNMVLYYAKYLIRTEEETTILRRHI